ncbi:MAG: sensor histidine kinase [Campylobacterales bacterium]
MKRLSLRWRVVAVVTAVYLLVFGTLSWQHLSVTQKHYLSSEHEKLAVTLQTLTPVLAVNLQLGFTEALGEPLIEVHRQNGDLLASRIVDRQGAVLFEYAADQADLARLDHPGKAIYHRQTILPPVAGGGEALGYLEALYSDRHYEQLLIDYGKLAVRSLLFFALALLIINLWLAYAFRPLGRLAAALGSYRPHKGPFVLNLEDGSPELETISKAAGDMLSRIRDYTDEIQRQMEENRRKDQVMFQQARQAQMGEMISMIAHQWRQPLSSIGTLSGNIRLLLELGQNDPKEILALLERINSHVQHLSSTVNDFRNLFNPNKREERVRLEEVCQKAAALLQSSFQKHGVELRMRFHFRQAVTTHPNELMQALISLIKNALDAVLEHTPQQPCVTIEGFEEDGWHHIHIRDNGGGVPEAIKDRIFDPYFSTKGEKNGTGLGLYMAKSVIEQHCRGRLSVQNVDDGALFALLIPSPTKEAS